MGLWYGSGWVIFVSISEWDHGWFWEIDSISIYIYTVPIRIYLVVPQNGRSPSHPRLQYYNGLTWDDLGVPPWIGNRHFRDAGCLPLPLPGISRIQCAGRCPPIMRDQENRVHWKMTLAGWWFESSWKIWVNGKDYPIYEMENRPVMFETTHQNRDLLGLFMGLNGMWWDVWGWPFRS